MKINQNAIVKVGVYKVVSTMTKVQVYLGNKLIGIAGVIKAKDFDFDTLFNLALHNQVQK